MTCLYRLKNILHKYGQRTVLTIDDLCIPAGGITGLAGPNGAGKSTLLRLLACVENPTKGEIFYQGKLCNIKEAPLRRDITMLTQNPYLLHRSVEKNIAYGLKIRKQKISKQKIDEVLQLTGLPPDEFRQRKWFELSGGETRRVALATRLILKPKVLLLDEPTANLDEESTKLIRDAALAASQKGNTTLVIVSHDLHWLKSVSQNIIRCEKGRIIVNSLAQKL